MRISDWSSDVCSSDLIPRRARRAGAGDPRVRAAARLDELGRAADRGAGVRARRAFIAQRRSEEHTSELQSLMRISYAVFCLKKKKLHIGTKSTNAQLNSN